jgi:hypothetical protein
VSKRNRNIEAFSLSFLDCICCGFGAIILLLVLSKIYEPQIIEKSQEDLQQLIALLQEELFEIRGETTIITRALSLVQTETSETKLTLKQLQKELESVQGQYRLMQEDDPLANIDEGELRAARQRLTAEMQRLQRYDRAPDDAVGGIPVDSEYIIFVIDTSGSMQSKWGWAEKKLSEVLDVYPRVKGLQIMNDNGRYMFQQYGGQWIPDTPQIRQSIRNTMRQWAPFSDSDPSETRRSASTSWATNSRDLQWKACCGRSTRSTSKTRTVTGWCVSMPSVSRIRSRARAFHRVRNASPVSCAYCASEMAVLLSH